MLKPMVPSLALSIGDPWCSSDAVWLRADPANHAAVRAEHLRTHQLPRFLASDKGSLGVLDSLACKRPAAGQIDAAMLP